MPEGELHRLAQEQGAGVRRPLRDRVGEALRLASYHPRLPKSWNEIEDDWRDEKGRVRGHTAAEKREIWCQEADRLLVLAPTCGIKIEVNGDQET